MVDAFLIHGICLGGSWGLFALIMVVTNRYMKQLWSINVKIHAILGFIVTGLTIGMAIYGIYNCGWELYTDNIHMWLASPVTTCVLLLAIGGSATRYKLQNSKWDTRTALNIKMVHKVFAYLIIAISIATVGTGIYFYKYGPTGEIL